MTRLRMHWQLVKEADGRQHLEMAWEAAQARRVPSLSRPQIHRSVRQKKAPRRRSFLRQMPRTSSKSSAFRLGEQRSEQKP